MQKKYAWYSSFSCCFLLSFTGLSVSPFHQNKAKVLLVSCVIVSQNRILRLSCVFSLDTSCYAIFDFARPHVHLKTFKPPLTMFLYFNINTINYVESIQKYSKNNVTSMIEFSKYLLIISSYFKSMFAARLYLLLFVLNETMSRKRSWTNNL